MTNLNLNINPWLEKTLELKEYLFKIKTVTNKKSYKK
jgi:hypothetical protein